MVSLIALARRGVGPLDWIAIGLLAAGLAFVATGLLPPRDASATVTRIAPLLLFLATILVLAELTAIAGVFDLAATRLAIMARGNFAALFALCVAFAAATTICLNLDTTAASLATLLWYERCTAAGLAIPARRLMLTGACLAVAGVTLAVAALLCFPG
jgi:arsenical pump membrane protein